MFSVMETKRNSVVRQLLERLEGYSQVTAPAVKRVNNHYFELAPLAVFQKPPQLRTLRDGIGPRRYPLLVEYPSGLPALLRAVPFKLMPLSRKRPTVQLLLSGHPCVCHCSHHAPTPCCHHPHHCQVCGGQLSTILPLSQPPESRTRQSRLRPHPKSSRLEPSAPSRPYSSSPSTPSRRSSSLPALSPESRIDHHSSLRPGPNLCPAVVHRPPRISPHMLGAEAWRTLFLLCLNYCKPKPQLAIQLVQVAHQCSPRIECIRSFDSPDACHRSNAFHHSMLEGGRIEPGFDPTSRFEATSLHTVSKDSRCSCGRQHPPCLFHQVPICARGLRIAQHTVGLPEATQTTLHCPPPINYCPADLDVSQHPRRESSTTPECSIATYRALGRTVWRRSPRTSPSTNPVLPGTPPASHCSRRPNH